LEVRPGPFLGHVERLGDDPLPYHFVILDFAVDLLDPQAEPVAASDASETAWLPVGRLRDLDLVDGLLDFLHDVGVLT
jgi:hypothetical protein